MKKMNMLARAAIACAATCAGAKYNGVKVIGEVSHETCPGWVMGRGVLYVQPRGTIVIFR